MQRALVIGGLGFLGGHLVEALARREIDVAVMRTWRRGRGMEGASRRAIVADLERDDLVPRLAGFNYVFYAAAPDPSLEGDAYLAASVRMIRRVLVAAREAQVERLAITSCASTVMASEGGEASSAEARYAPGSARDERVEATWAVELECAREAADNLDLTVLNPGICLGEGAVFPSKRALGALAPEQRINVVDARDVASAHLGAVARLYYGRRFVLGGRNTTVGQVRSALQETRDGRGRLWGYELTLVDDVDALRHRALFRRGCWLDSAQAAQELGFRSRLA